MFALVYLRPDGWWEAGRDWDSFAQARRDGEIHDWHGTDWGIVKLDDDAPKIEAAAQHEVIFTALFKGKALSTKQESNVANGLAFQNLNRLQNDLFDLSVKAHDTGYHTWSNELAAFRTRVEELRNDLELYFYDHQQVLRELTGE